LFYITEQEKAMNFESICDRVSRERAIREDSTVEPVDCPEGIELPQYKVIKPKEKQVKYLFSDGTAPEDYLNL
jgi:hypothetical protein